MVQIRPIWGFKTSQKQICTSEDFLKHESEVGRSQLSLVNLERKVSQTEREQLWLLVWLLDCVIERGRW